MRADRLGIRWTIGDVSDRGFEALRLSVWGAWRLFGPEAAYVVCANSVPLETARACAGELPPGVLWRDVTGELPAFLRERLDSGMAEGVGWKLAPLRLFPDRYELALDNDCILWELPRAIRAWLEAAEGESFVFAEDVARCLGQFDALCGPGARNSGIRGLPPGFDYEAALRAVLAEQEGRTGRRLLLLSELDEQGLQAAAVERSGPVHLVTVEEVAICSPFPPHLPDLGRCGAHFVGTNARRMPWEWQGRNGAEHLQEHWLRHRDALYAHVFGGAAAPGSRPCAPC